MIVYVETNFVLEVALLQEQVESCRQILDHCNQKRLTLAVPAFSLAETYATLIRRHRERADLGDRLARELQQLGLTMPDATVYASVLSHLSTTVAGPKCFLNRNSKDFMAPGIQSELKARRCRLIPSFEHGLAYIEHGLQSGSDQE